MKKLLATLLALTLLTTAALADAISLEGTVQADETVVAYAPIGGTVDQIYPTVGDRISSGDIIAQLKTSAVYAPEDGTVSGLFVQPGDSAEETTEKYGAVLYLEGKESFTVSASTNNAYSSAETKFIHTGEAVYLLCRKDSERIGTGIVTAVSGTSFTVLVQESNLIAGDSVDVYRDSDHSNALRIGRGNVTRRDPTAITAVGSIASIAVRDGQSVKKGDLLFETLDGSYAGYVATGSTITSPVSGILTSLSVAQGNAIAQDSTVATIVPEGKLHLEAEIPEEDLHNLTVGDKVKVELTADEDEDIAYSGTVRSISAAATEGAENVTYKVVIDFPADAHVRLGMSATVSTEEEEAPTAEAVDEEAEDSPEVEPAE